MIAPAMTTSIPEPEHGQVVPSPGQPHRVPELREENRLGAVKTVCLDEIIEYVAECLARRMRKYAIKNHLREILQLDLAPSTFEKLLSKAREYILAAAKRPKSEHFALTVRFYEDVIASEESTIKDRMAAMKELSDIAGIGSRFQTPRAPEDDAALIRKAVRAIDDLDQDEDGDDEMDDI